jgi:hypothetical protein
MPNELDRPNRLPTAADSVRVCHHGFGCRSDGLANQSVASLIAEAAGAGEAWSPERGPIWPESGFKLQGFSMRSKASGAAFHCAFSPYDAAGISDGAKTAS